MLQVSEGNVDCYIRLVRGRSEIDPCQRGSVLCFVIIRLSSFPIWKRKHKNCELQGFDHLWTLMLQVSYLLSLFDIGNTKSTIYVQRQILFVDQIHKDSKFKDAKRLYRRVFSLVQSRLSRLFQIFIRFSSLSV